MTVQLIGELADWIFWLMEGSNYSGVKGCGKDLHANSHCSGDLTYLKMTQHKVALGLLINFNVQILKQGIEENRSYKTSLWRSVSSVVDNQNRLVS